MSRQYEVDDGKILFYGNTYENLGMECVRNEIALISQETIIFPMSVLDNIRIGNPVADKEKILEAAKKAGCHDFIMKLPQGYDTELEERGNNLSGGQKQRITIARAILKDAPIILLDEPTSALDQKTQDYVNHQLIESSKGKMHID